MSGYDWSQWERKGLDPSVVAEVRTIMEQGVEEEKKLLPELLKENQLDVLEKDIKDAFNGPGGFLELAAKEEKAATASMQQCLADMEKLEIDAVGLRDVTIAESKSFPRHDPNRLSSPDSLPWTRSPRARTRAARGDRGGDQEQQLGL